MIEKIYETRSGNIHYWINDNKSKLEYTLVFLPGLTADHRLFEKQLEYMKDINIRYLFGMRLDTRHPILLN